MRRGLPGLLLVACAVVALLATAGSAPSAAAAAHPGPGGGGGRVSRTDAAGTVWLCRPGLADDPCAGDLTATAVAADGGRTVQPAKAAGSPRFDCFYVYPTASPQLTVNANLQVQPAEVDVAEAQAARFSQVCDVWAPMYRQVTVGGLVLANTTDQQANTVAYDSLLSGFEDFLAHDDDGRPIIFIGHSQGSAMLIRLLEHQVDDDPRLRAKMVLAIIAGGNVTVPTGATVGATFRHIPLCTAAGDTGCVIAYSSFPSEPPAHAFFGRPGQGVSAQSGQTATSGVQVACVNPAALAGGPAALSPYFPTAGQVLPAPVVTTPWVSYPGLYTATCESGGGATWLQVTEAASAGEARPVLTESLGPLWGYHLDDINLALGNLVADARAAETGYLARHR